MTGRGEAWGLTAISGLFVLAGIFITTVVGDVALGGVCIVFFGSGLIIGPLQLVSLRRGGTGEPTGPLAMALMAVASFLLGVACLALLLLTLVDGESIAPPGRSPLVAALVGAVGAVFFGGGSGLLAVRALVLLRR